MESRQSTAQLLSNALFVDTIELFPRIELLASVTKIRYSHVAEFSGHLASLQLTLDADVRFQ